MHGMCFCSVFYVCVGFIRNATIELLVLWDCYNLLGIVFILNICLFVSVVCLIMWLELVFNLIIVLHLVCTIKLETNSLVSRSVLLLIL